MIRSRRGVSLVELIVAAAAAVLVGAGLTTGLVNFSQRSVRENNLGLLQTNLRRALQYIAQDLEKAEFIYDTGSLAGPVPALSGATPLLAFWKRIAPDDPDYDPNNPVYHQVVYYWMPPPDSSFVGPNVVGRLQRTADPDTNNDRFVSTSEALAYAASGATTTDPGFDVLIDRVAASDGLRVSVVNNRTVLIALTGDADKLPGSNSLDATAKEKLRQQISVSMRNR